MRRKSGLFILIQNGQVIRWAVDTEWRERTGGPDGGHLGEGRRPGTEKTVYMNKK